MMPVRLSVTFVHCDHRVRWIPYIFAYYYIRLYTYWQRLTRRPYLKGLPLYWEGVQALLDTLNPHNFLA